MFEVTWNYLGREGNNAKFDNYTQAKKFFNYIRNKTYVTRAELKVLEAV
jgi:hypothetical protein